MVSFWAVVAAFGIPSAFMGFVIWRLERKIEARDRAQEKKNQDQQKLFLLIVQGTRAATALGEATAMLCSAATRTVTWKRLSPMPPTSSTSRRSFWTSRESKLCGMTKEVSANETV